MRMIDRVISSMYDTGLIDSMTLEDADTLATAALEAMREPTKFMGQYVRGSCGGISHDYEYSFWIEAALNE